MPKLSKLPKLSRASAFKQLFDEGFNFLTFGRRNVHNEGFAFVFFWQGFPAGIYARPATAAAIRRCILRAHLHRPFCRFLPTNANSLT